eukprot:m.62367 g.62367  ORF g.62367 m.62367 type:complete len:512 (+) comp17675_c0_seq5:2208-3743(+)
MAEVLLGVAKPDLPDTAGDMPSRSDFCTRTFARVCADTGLCRPLGNLDVRRTTTRKRGKSDHVKVYNASNKSRADLRADIMSGGRHRTTACGRGFGRPLKRTDKVLGEDEYDPTRRRAWTDDELESQVKVSGVEANLCMLRSMQFGWCMPPKEFNKFLDGPETVYHPLLGLIEDAADDAAHGPSMHDRVAQLLTNLNDTGNHTVLFGKNTGDTVSVSDMGLDDVSAGQELSVHVDDDPEEHKTTLDRFIASQPRDTILASQRCAIVELIANDIDPTRIQVTTTKGWQLLFGDDGDDTPVPDGFIEACKAMWGKIKFGGTGLDPDIVHTHGSGSTTDASDAICALMSEKEWSDVPGLFVANPATIANNKRKRGDNAVTVPRPIKLTRYFKTAEVHHPNAWASADLTAEQDRFIATVIAMADSVGVDWNVDVARAVSVAPLTMAKRPVAWLVAANGSIANREVNKAAVLCSVAGRRLVFAAMALRRCTHLTAADVSTISEGAGIQAPSDSEDE